MLNLLPPNWQLGLTKLYLASNNIGDEGAKELANVLKSNSTLTTLNLRKNQIRDAESKEINEKINYNKVLFQKFTSLLYNYFCKNNSNTEYAFKVLNANKFYQVANKQSLKKYLAKQGVNEIEIKLQGLDNFINQKAFTIAGVCKAIQPNTKVMPGELHVSNLPTEIIYKIISYLQETTWGLNAESVKSEIIEVSDELTVLSDVENIVGAVAPGG